jgi:hypothetical protein
MMINCNIGTCTTRSVGDLKGYGTVWYDPNCIANILSLKRVFEKFHVTYCNDKDGAKFQVHKPNGQVVEFVKSSGGLYHFDTDNGGRTQHKGGVTLVNTVDDNKVRYNKADYLQACKAMELQTKIGRPSTREFIHIIKNNLLPNCPITHLDMLAAEDIFGPDLGSLKGKTVQRPPHTMNAKTILASSSIAE